MEKSIKIIVAELQPIFLQAFVTFLKSVDKAEVTGTQLEGEDLRNFIEKETPDILFLDIRLSKHNGIDNLKKISTGLPQIHVIAISTFDHPEHIKKILRYGAKGFLSKNKPVVNIEKAVSAVLKGEIYLSDELSRQMLLYYSKTDNPDSELIFKPLTEREIEVVRKISNGMKTKEIAAQLFVSNKTIERHKTNILKKLNLQNSVQLVKIAYQYGILEL